MCWAKETGARINLGTVGRVVVGRLLLYSSLLLCAAQKRQGGARVYIVKLTNRRVESTGHIDGKLCMFILPPSSRESFSSFYTRRRGGRLSSYSLWASSFVTMCVCVRVCIAADQTYKFQQSKAELYSTPKESVLCPVAQLRLLGGYGSTLSVRLTIDVLRYRLLAASINAESFLRLLR